MKTILLTLFTLILFTTTYAQKGVVEDSIFVSGNCEMCKVRIEKSLDKKGVKLAVWNQETKNLFIAYKPNKISEEEIHEAIASVGHDTKKKKAADAVYAELPFCCLHRDQSCAGEEVKEGHHLPKQ